MARWAGRRARWKRARSKRCSSLRRDIWVRWELNGRSDLKKDADKPVLLVDKALEGRVNLIGGANKEDYHLKNI